MLLRAQIWFRTEVLKSGSDNWSIGEGTTVVEDAEAPEGSHYLKDNGNTHSWGDGSSQSGIAVEPEYRLYSYRKLQKLAETQVLITLLVHA